MTFEVARDGQNRLSAANVRYGASLTTPRPRRAPGNRGVWPAAFLAVAALSASGAMAMAGQLPLLLPLGFVVASLVVFLAYAFDKSAAMNRRRRTPENVLHLLNLIGGWPGALVASRLFHHKSKKLEFRVVFCACIVLNCTAVAWLAWAQPLRHLAN